MQHPVVRCRVCGGTDVQVVDWTYPNKGVIAGDEPWQADAASGETWCETCEDHTQLIWYAAAFKLEQLATACGYDDVSSFLDHHNGDPVAPGICIVDGCDVMALQVSDPRACEGCGWNTVIAATQL